MTSLDRLNVIRYDFDICLDSLDCKPKLLETVLKTLDRLPEDVYDDFAYDKKFFFFLWIASI